MTRAGDSEQRILAALRAGDVGAFKAMIDWPASGVANLVRALWDVDPLDRREAARTGLANLRTEGVTTPLSLSWLAPCLSSSPGLRPARAEERAQVFGLLRVPRLPPEIEDACAREIDELAGRLDPESDVLELVCGERIPCALLIDSNRMVLSRYRL
jgi:hypothetical protein